LTHCTAVMVKDVETSNLPADLPVVLRQPGSGLRSCAQLAKDMVTATEDVTKVHRMELARHIVLRVLLEGVLVVVALSIWQQYLRP